MAAKQLIVRCRVKEGAADEVLALLTGYTEVVRAEPGNISFEVFRQVDDDRAFVSLELYESPEAHVTHRSSANYQETMLGKIGPLLDRYDVESFEV